MLKKICPVIAALMVILAVGCSSSDQPSSKASDLQGRVWVLQQVSGAAVEAPAGGQKVHIEFKADSSMVTGYTGCNSMGGTFYQNADTLVFGHLVSTRMACDEGMEVESAMMDALEATKTFQVVGDALVLNGDDGELARFQAQDAREPMAR